jgi:predicted nucleotidyltransferase
MTLDTVTIEEIVNRIRRIAEPDRIIMFGSAATGDMHSDSDVDLLVLISSCADRRRHAVKIRKGLRGLGLPFDVIIMETARFEETKNVIGGISYPANKYGKVIYENPR